MTQVPPSTLRKDLIASYAAAGAKVGSWAVVSAVAFRWQGAEVLGVLALARGTMGLLNYVTLGLGPAMVHFLADADHPKKVLSIEPPTEARTSVVLDYARPPAPVVPKKPVDPLTSVYAHGLMAGFLLAIAGGALLALYAHSFEHWHVVPKFLAREELSYFIMGIGGGLLARLLSDIAGGVMQVRRHQAIDQTIVALGDILWVTLLLTLTYRDPGKPLDFLAIVGRTYFASGVFVLLVRVAGGAYFTGGVSGVTTSYPFLGRLLAFGSLLTLAQLADFLYAPTDMILINRFVSPQAVAAYTPVIQIDAALLLLVAGLANVILPRAALAHAAGDVALLKRDYVRGTLVSFTLLFVGAVVIWLTSPLLFKLWFNDPLPAAQAILPLVLIHTVVGGSSAVGRSILLGMGRVKPYTVAALLAGVMNVVLSYSFVRFFNLGLNGIVLGTIIVVVARCALWMPWYVWRVLGKNNARLGVDDDRTEATPIV